MNSSVKQNITVTFEKLKAAYNSTKLVDAKDYYLTLGNFNEIYLMKKDATKSVFLGKIFDNDDATIESEGKKILDVLTNYFKSAVVATSETPVVEEPKVEKKTTKRAKKVETPVVDAVPEVSDDFASDDDTSWVDAIQ